MSIEAEDEEHKIEVEDLLMDIIEQLKLIKMHVSIMTGEKITKGDIDV